VIFKGRASADLAQDFSNVATNAFVFWMRASFFIHFSEKLKEDLKSSEIQTSIQRLKNYKLQSYDFIN